MGFSISWVGFQGLTKSEALQMIGATDSGLPDEANEAPFSGAEIPDGWYIFFSNDFGFLAEDRLESFSAKGPLVACQVHEGIMISAAYGYEQGAQRWAVMHDSQKGICDLSVSGSPPPAFEGIRDRLSKEQESNGGETADVDYFFDIPVETAEAVCSYRHDRAEFGWGQPAFKAINLPRRRWWTRWGRPRRAAP